MIFFCWSKTGLRFRQRVVRIISIVKRERCAEDDVLSRTDPRTHFSVVILILRMQGAVYQSAVILDSLFHIPALRKIEFAFPGLPGTTEPG